MRSRKSSTEPRPTQSVSVRELRKNQTAIRRRDQANGDRVRNTDGGKRIARLVPLRETQSSAGMDPAWRDIDRLVKEIGPHWPVGLSAIDAMGDVNYEPSSTLRSLIDSHAPKTFLARCNEQED
jgi:antitoxin (DNA-binding transcriptional repressor) of toxin-antitoxin stability system